MADCRAPVAVFDSGLGGIGVLRELVRTLPMENYLYFGDSLHAPYGTKTPEEVAQHPLDRGMVVGGQGIRGDLRVQHGDQRCHPDAAQNVSGACHRRHGACHQARGGAPSGRQNSDAGDGNDRAGGEVPAAQGAV